MTTNHESKHGVLWSFTGIRNTNIPGQDVIELGHGFSLVRPTPQVLAARVRSLMTDDEYEISAHCERYLISKNQVMDVDAYERDPNIERQKSMESLHNGLMAFQIVKPSQTLGFSFQGLEFRETLFPEQVHRRAPMDVGQWARMRSFAPDFFA